MSRSQATGYIFRLPKVFPNAKAAAQKALELDDTLGEAHAALAYATYYEIDLLSEFDRRASGYDYLAFTFSRSVYGGSA